MHGREGEGCVKKRLGMYRGVGWGLTVLCPTLDEFQRWQGGGWGQEEGVWSLADGDLAAGHGVSNPEHTPLFTPAGYQ